MAKSHYPLIKRKLIVLMISNTGLRQLNQFFQWFTFHAIMEYTGNIMQDDMHLTSSLLKMFSMFEIRLSCGDDDLDIV